jgi:hypothetical protein
MIDYEREIYTRVVERVQALHGNVEFSGVDERLPSKFPSVSLVEADSTTRTETIDSGSFENHVNVMYEVNVYSNKSGGRKTECKAILATIDETFIRMGFARSMRNPVSMDDATIYRMVARYTAAIDKNGKIYRR